MVGTSNGSNVCMVAGLIGMHTRPKRERERARASERERRRAVGHCSAAEVYAFVIEDGRLFERRGRAWLGSTA